MGILLVKTGYRGGGDFDSASGGNGVKDNRLLRSFGQAPKWASSPSWLGLL